MDALQGTGSFTLTVERGGERMGLVRFESESPHESPHGRVDERLWDRDRERLHLR